MEYACVPVWCIPVCVCLCGVWLCSVCLCGVWLCGVCLCGVGMCVCMSALLCVCKISCERQRIKTVATYVSDGLPNVDCNFFSFL